MLTVLIVINIIITTGIIIVIGGKEGRKEGGMDIRKDIWCSEICICEFCLGSSSQDGGGSKQS